MRIARERRHAEAHGDARPDVVTERHRAQEMPPVDAERFAHGERRRHHGAAGMGQRGRVRVVGLVGVRQHAVGERGLDRPAQHVGADHGGEALTAVAAGEFYGGAAGGEMRAGNHGREGVEHVVLGFLRHLVRQRALARSVHVAAQRRHHRPDRLRAGGKPGGKRRRRRAALQDAPPRHRRRAARRFPVALTGHIHAPCGRCEPAMVTVAANRSTQTRCGTAACRD